MLKLDMINQALVKGGQSMVSAVTETKASRLLHAQYRFSLKAVLASTPWDQFKKYVTLEAQTSGDDYVVPDLEYSYQFVVPFDFCRLVEEYDTGYNYDRVTGLFYYNESTFPIIYVAFPYSGDWSAIQESFTNWSELPATSTIFDNVPVLDTVAEAVQYHMLAACAYNITGDHKDTELFKGLYRQELTGAKTTSAQQKPNMVIETTDWTDARG